MHALAQYYPTFWLPAHNLAPRWISSPDIGEKKMVVKQCLQEMPYGALHMLSGCQNHIIVTTRVCCNERVLQSLKPKEEENSSNPIYVCVFSAESVRVALTPQNWHKRIYLLSTGPSEPSSCCAQ
eukprot:1149816-Pelagomonas_calceolata.AAC.4